MTIPHWSTIGLFICLVPQFILSWLQAKKTAKSFREALLPSALIAGAISIGLVREFFGDLPLLIEVPIASLCWLLTLIALGLSLVRLKRYLKEAWRLEAKKDSGH